MSFATFFRAAIAGPLGADDASRPMRFVAVASVITVLAAALLAMGMVWWSASRADQATMERLRQTVGFALRKNIAQISYDQESVANWNDAVINTRNTFDPAWVDVYLGAWMYDYFKHDRIEILDANNTMIYAMAAGGSVELGDRRPPNVVSRLASQLRTRIDYGALDAYEAHKTRIPRSDDLGFVDNRPAIVSVMPLVPHNQNISQGRGTEFLIASIRFLDQSFLTDLGDAYLLEGVHYSRGNDIAANEQSYPLRSAQGENIGSIVWTPKLPGQSILSEVMPVLATGLTCIGIAIAFLIYRLRRTYTELVISEAQATHLAFHDTLTGLPNRGFFKERLEDALLRVREGHEQLALIFLDLDRFKQVNDSFGHATGDALICELARHLKATLKPGDVLARMGGDEFAIVMRDVHSRAEVEDLCRRIVNVVSRPFNILGSQASVGISVGIAMAPETGLDRSELARKADIALYQAKRSGGLSFCFFTEDMCHAVEERRELEFELLNALENEDGLEVVFQPLYEAKTLTPDGAEALLRWNHPRLGAVAPQTFIGLAEDCGLIDRLGDLVLRRACTVCSAWDLRTVSVNVSAMQLRKPDFAERTLALLEQTGMDPRRLEIEITESTLIGGSEVSAKMLKALRAAGIKVSLDDFGTGYSSLSYLMRLDVDRIKIDRSFVRQLGETTQSNSIVQAIVTMAHAVGLAVTAEGVETEQQRDFLIDLGCSHLQGYLFSPPISALRMIELLAGKDRTTGEAKTEAA